MAHRRGGTQNLGGIFLARNGNPLKIWLDPRLPNRLTLAELIKRHGGSIAINHTTSTTQMLILHPRSIEIFDLYCHPSWLGGVQRSSSGGWKRKVILTDAWISRCIEACRVLSEQDNWGGCRKGGPPVQSASQVRSPSTLVDEPSIASSSKIIARLPKRASSIPSLAKSTSPLDADSTRSRSTSPDSHFSEDLDDAGEGNTSSFEKANVRQLSMSALDDIFRDAHLLAMRADDYGVVKDHLTATRQEYASGSWETIYADWRKCRRRFTALALDNEHDQYTLIFEPLFPLVMEGHSLDSIAIQLSTTQTKYGHSVRNWKRLFGNWLRSNKVTCGASGVGKKVVVRDEKSRRRDKSGGLREANKRSRENNDESRRRAAKKLKLATIFKGGYDCLSLKPLAVARAIAPQTGYSVASVEMAYRLWRVRDVKYASMPSELQATSSSSEIAIPKRIVVAPVIPSSSANSQISVNDNSEKHVSVPTTIRSAGRDSYDESARRLAIRVELATFFKRDYDSPSFTPRGVGKEIAAKTSHGVGSAEQAYRRWRILESPYDLLPKDLHPSLGHSNAISSKTVTRGENGKRSGPSISPYLGKRVRVGEYLGNFEPEVVEICDSSDEE